MEAFRAMVSGLDIPTSPYAIICTAILLLLLALYWLGTEEFSILKKLNVPGPSPLPFLGNLLLARRHGSMDKAFAECVKKYGKVFSFCLGRRPVIVVADPEMIKEITVKEFSKFRTRDIPFREGDVMDAQFEAAEYEKWRRVRNTITPAFSGSKMKLMVPMMRESCSVLEAKLEEVIETGGSVDIRPLVEQLSLEILLSCAFGVTSNVQRNPQSEYVKRAKVLVTSRRGLFLYLPALPFQWLVRKLGSRIMGGLGQYFHQVSKSIISQRKEQGITPSARKDLVYLMMQAQESGGESRFSDEEMAEQSVNFLVNGYHTTSTFLTRILHYLALYPEVQNTLYNAINDDVTENPDKPLYDMIMGLEYLSCVIDEVIRVTFAGGVVINRRCVESCDINGIHFPKGIQVVLSQYLLHHDADAWENPEEFDPDRFQAEAKASRHPFQYLGFGSGPRMCIGMRFAQLELRLALVSLMRKYEFVKSPNTEEPVTAGMPPASVHLRIKKRATVL